MRDIMNEKTSVKKNSLLRLMKQQSKMLLKVLNLQKKYKMMSKKITSKSSQSNANDVTEKKGAANKEPVASAEVSNEHKVENDANQSNDDSKESSASREVTSNKDAKAHVTDSLIALNGPEGPEGPHSPEGVEKLGQQIDGVHQQTVKDELPTLGLNDLTPDQLGKLQSAVGSLDPNESLEDQGITLTWKTKPDVDAVGDKLWCSRAYLH